MNEATKAALLVLGVLLFALMIFAFIKWIIHSAETGERSFASIDEQASWLNWRNTFQTRIEARSAINFPMSLQLAESQFPCWKSKIDPRKQADLWLSIHCHFAQQ